MSISFSSTLIRMSTQLNKIHFLMKSIGELSHYYLEGD